MPESRSDFTDVEAAFSPLYRQIMALLVRSLVRGEWKPGELIPSEVNLAARFQVSQGTVRKAVDELAGENMLQRRQGKGTFVSTHHEAHTRYRFLRLAPDDDNGAAVAQSHVLKCQRVRASAEVARVLELRVGNTVVVIRRLLAFGGIPSVVDDIWLPGVAFKHLTVELLQHKCTPLYALFESEFGVSMVRADEKLHARAAPVDIANILHVSMQCPVLQVERVSYTYSNKPMELRLGWYLTERYHYRNSLN